MLSCGSGGSTGQQIVEAINDNTASRGFHYVAEADILDVPEALTPIAELDVPALPQGIYMILWSVTYDFDSITTSAELQVTINGEVETFSNEPSDITDRIPAAYAFPFVQEAEGPFHALLEAGKETAAGILNVYYANITVDKKTSYIPAPP